MNTAVLIYQSTPMLGRNNLPNGTILGMVKHKKVVTKLNDELQKKNSPWQVILDDSIADIEVIAPKADAIICVPGSQKLVDLGNYPKEKIFYFDSLDYHNVFFDKVITFLETVA